MNAEFGRQIRTYAEGPLRARPDGQLVLSTPFGHRHSRFKRHVRDVGDRVALGQLLVRLRHALIDGAAALPVFARSGIGFEVSE